MAPNTPPNQARRGIDAMLTLPCRPYPLSCLPQALGLVIIDMQRDFIEPGGFGEALGNDVTPLAAIVPAVRRVLDAFRIRGLAVIHTKEAHRPDLSDCPPAKRRKGPPGMTIGDTGPMGRILVAGEPGNDFIPELRPMPGEKVIEKPGKGAFYATGLQDHLHRLGLTHLLFCGVTTEVCVQTSMREAADRGYECAIVEDATESYFPAFKTAAIDMMTAQNGIVGCAVNSTDILAALNRGAAR